MLYVIYLYSRRRCGRCKIEKGGPHRTRIGAGPRGQSVYDIADSATHWTGDLVVAGRAVAMRPAFSRRRPKTRLRKRCLRVGCWGVVVAYWKVWGWVWLVFSAA